MKDMIEDRDRRRHIASTVIKWWNVKYITDEESADEESANEELTMEPEPVEGFADDNDYIEDGFEQSESDDGSDMLNSMSEEDRQAAMDIIERLNREALEDELAKALEIEQIKADVKQKEEEILDIMGRPEAEIQKIISENSAE